jgi:hypothetical protein
MDLHTQLSHCQECIKEEPTTKSYHYSEARGSTTTTTTATTSTTPSFINNTIMHHDSPSSSSSSHSESFAIVGMGMRFPGEIDAPEKLWEALLKRVCTIAEVPPDRWHHASFYHHDQDKVGKTVSKWASYVKDIESFDPSFFHISPREAGFMDPQQRMLLMTTWEAFEDAGIHPSDVAHSCGVFVGVGMMDYPVLLGEDSHLMGNMYSNTGFAHSALANRVSFVWDMKGPSYVVDTACSSALTAFHTAFQYACLLELNVTPFSHHQSIACLFVYLLSLSCSLVS